MRAGVSAAAALALAPAAGASGEGAPTLTYAQAKKAAQVYATAFAAGDASSTNDTLKTQPVVGTLFRISRLVSYAQASWTKTDPVACKQCGYGETTGTFYDTPEDLSCFVDLKVVRSATKPYRTREVVRDSSCL